MATYESRRYNTPVPDASKIADGSVNNTEFEHLDGVTSDIQTQLTARLPIAGGTMTGSVTSNDNVRARFGSSNDLQIYHDGSNSIINNSVGALVVNADTIQFKNLADNATFLTLNSSSSFLSLADVYPVGSIYINATNATNPATLLGFGTWVAFGAGRVPVGIDGTDTDFDTTEETGGGKTHTLAEANLPSHNHYLFANHSMEQNANSDWVRRYGNAYKSDGIEKSASLEGYQASGSDDFKYSIAFDRNNATPSVHPSSATGSGDAVSHMNPYIVVYMWKRTA